MKRKWCGALWGGMIAGALDIAYACVHYALVYQVPPLRIFQSVAAGVLGREAARAGGWATGTLGLGLHFFIALAMAFAFVVLASKWRGLLNKPWVTGTLYGLFLFAVMNLVVVPVSAAGGSPPKGQFLAGGILAHMFLVGMPILLFAKRGFKVPVSH